MFVVGAEKTLSWIMHYDLCPYAAGVAKSMVVMLGAIDVHMSSKGGLLSELYRAMRARVCVFLSRLGCHDDGPISFCYLKNLSHRVHFDGIRRTFVSETKLC